MQAVTAIPVDDIIALAKSHTDKCQFRTASQIYYAVVERCDELPKADRIRYCKLQLAVVQEIPTSKREALDHKATMRSGMVIFTGSKMGTSDWKLGLGTLMQLYKSGAKIEDNVLAGILMPIAISKMGFTTSNPNPTIEERAEGMAAGRRAAACWGRTYLSGERRAIPYRHWKDGNSSRLCIGPIPVDIWTTAHTDIERLMWSSEMILETARSYDYESMHEQMGSTGSHDSFLETGESNSTIGLRHSNVAGTQEIAKIWTEGQLINHAGGGHMCMEFFQVLVGFRLTQEVSGVREVTWR
jgi:hypothetical protein